MQPASRVPLRLVDLRFSSTQMMVHKECTHYEFVRTLLADTMAGANWRD